MIDDVVPVIMCRGGLGLPSASAGPLRSDRPDRGTELPWFRSNPTGPDRQEVQPRHLGRWHRSPSRGTPCRHAALVSIALVLLISHRTIICRLRACDRPRYAFPREASAAGRARSTWRLHTACGRCPPDSRLWMPSSASLGSAGKYRATRSHRASSRAE